MVVDLIKNIWLVYLDTAFWMLIGLLAAGFIKSYISEGTMKRWVGGRGIAAILRAALFGAPLPLCSCGVLPAAIGLRRAGASKEATVAFLISTPETSLDSVAVTYALMGPVMAIFRPIAALINAVGVGLLTALVSEDKASEDKLSETKSTDAAVDGLIVESCCSSNKQEAETVTSSCCETNSPEDQQSGSSCCATKKDIKVNKLMQVLTFSCAELLDDLSTWLAIGIVLAGAMMTFIPPDWLSQWGGGLSAMLVMLVVGVPMYICAVASTPIAAGLLLAGVSPGAVLVFLLVGPATNIASFAVVKQQLGLKVTAMYITGLSVISLIMGLLLEWLLETQHWQIQVNLGEAHHLLPEAVAWTSAFVLLFFAIRPLRRAVFPRLG
jgi:uncharacterized membrane protein YraQ (UPF0718 family)